MVKKNNKTSSSKSTPLISMNGLNNIINTNTNSMKKYFRNNYELLKGIFSFILAIGLIVVLYNVYKYYKDDNRTNNINLNNLEGFEQQEPYDLLDKIKSNIYRLDTIWSNQLYNFQPGIQETPIAFWEITKQDNAYKVIGHAVNNKIEELQHNLPIAPKNKTMLVDGDTKPPADVKLIYKNGDNIITEKTADYMGRESFKQEYINIKNMDDIEKRLDILKNLYNVMEKTKTQVMQHIENDTKYTFDNLYLNTYLYGFNNYFGNPNVVLSSKLGQRVKSIDGNYNCARIPLGCEVVFTFSTGKEIRFDHDYNSILSSDKTEYVQLDNNNIFTQQDGTMFQYMNFFDIFSEFGINKANPNINTRFRGKITSGKKRTISYPYNYSASDIIANGTGKNKEGLYKYIEDKISDKDLRKKTIKGFKQNENQPSINVVISSEGAGKTAYITTNPVGGNFTHHHHVTSDEIVLRDRGKMHSISTTKGSDGVEAFTLNDNKRYTIPNSRIYVEDQSLNFSIDIGILLSEADTEFKKYSDELWFTNILQNFGDVTLINKDNLISGIITFKNTDFLSYSGNKLTIMYPSFYLDFTFNYPDNRTGFDRRNTKCTRKQALKKCNFSGENRYALISHYDEGNIPLHNDTKISSLDNKDFYLKSVSVKSNYNINNHPLYKTINNFKNSIKNKFDNIINKIITSSNLLNALRDKILSNNFNHYPMKIYRPIAPKYYKSIGDLIYAETSSFRNDTNFYNTEPNVSQIACVPEQCVREVREWLPVDKIYEYQKNGDYLAIFKNPYLETFRAVTTPGTLPPGKVEKVVACVERCKLVDDIIQADKCAKTFYKTHKNITDTFNMDPDNVINERKNQIYKNKIVERQDRINMLKETARRLQIQDDKANLINEAYNRNKLQDLVDKQNANMHKLVDKLEKGRNKIEIRVKFNYDMLFKLCSNGGLPNDVCSYVQENIRRPSDTLTDAERRQYDTNAVAALLDSCPTPESEGLVKRALVENNCGCYFSDEELETTN
jgi:3'-phosphoadenosine 5'-phosphosulfate sulfotransferase